FSFCYKTILLIVNAYINFFQCPCFLSFCCAHHRYNAYPCQDHGQQCLHYFTYRYFAPYTHLFVKIFLIGCTSLSISPAPAVISNSILAASAYCSKPSLLNMCLFGLPI